MLCCCKIIRCIFEQKSLIHFIFFFLLFCLFFLLIRYHQVAAPQPPPPAIPSQPLSTSGTDGAAGGNPTDSTNASLVNGMLRAPGFLLFILMLSHAPFILRLNLKQHRCFLYDCVWYAHGSIMIATVALIKYS